ncbi:hypothetical protein [Thermogutta sp.]|uniref:hypothetical protein n=1 Tax=Thermogutta sp. TaxID=1962930 RepID=UPI0032201A8E
MLARHIGGTAAHYWTLPQNEDWSSISHLLITLPFMGSYWTKKTCWRIVIWVWEAIRAGVPTIVYAPDALMISYMVRLSIESGGERKGLFGNWVREQGVQELVPLGYGPKTVAGPMYELYTKIIAWHDLALEDGPPMICWMHYQAEDAMRQWWQTRRKIKHHLQRLFVWDPGPILVEAIQETIRARRDSLVVASGWRSPCWEVDALRRRNQDLITEQIAGKTTWPVVRYGAGYRKVPGEVLINEILPTVEGTILWREDANPQPPGHFRPRMYITTEVGTPMGRTVDYYHYLPVPIEVIPTCLEIERLYSMKGSGALRDLAAEQRSTLHSILPPREWFLEVSWPRVTAHADNWWDANMANLQTLCKTID